MFKWISLLLVAACTSAPEAPPKVPDVVIDPIPQDVCEASWQRAQQLGCPYEEEEYGQWIVTCDRDKASDCPLSMTCLQTRLCLEN